MIPAPRDAAWPTLTTGHGTGNDFVLFTDEQAEIDLTPAAVRALADRRFGVGGDGVIRVVRSEALAAQEPDVTDLLASQATHGRTASWFMDYRNADGSVAQMCGNGARVFVRYLLAEGLLTLPDGEAARIATRAGVLDVRREGDLLAVDMGPFALPGGEGAIAAGWDAQVAIAGLEGTRPGLRVTMPNPHVVVAVASQDELEHLDLTWPPSVSPHPSEGTNVEILHLLGESGSGGEAIGTVSMRVHERGVGETLSCGTGACAAAVAARLWAGQQAPDRWLVQVPGGELEVRFGPRQGVELIGPAELIANVQVR